MSVLIKTMTTCAVEGQIKKATVSNLMQVEKY